MSGLSTIWHPQPRLQVIAAAGRPVTTCQTDAPVKRSLTAYDHA
jgi:hypothetical protein